MATNIASVVDNFFVCGYVLDLSNIIPTFRNTAVASVIFDLKVPQTISMYLCLNLRWWIWVCVYVFFLPFRYRYPSQIEFMNNNIFVTSDNLNQRYMKSTEHRLNGAVMAFLSK